MSGCREHSRSELLRRGAAEAGRGLPAIEPGMPLPAGSGLSRRSFVARTLGLALTVYGGSAVGAGRLEDGIAAAADPRRRILVSIFLDGGADSLSMLFPHEDPLYRKLRPRLALPAGTGTAFAGDDRLRWHPALAPLATLHAEGKVTTFPAIGYTDANQSHFTSRHYWEVGATDARLATGWLGRYLDRVGERDNPLQGLALDWSLLPSLATSRVPVASVDAPDTYEFWTRGVWGETEQRMRRAIGSLGQLPSGGDAALEQAAAAADQSWRLYEQLAPFRPVEKDGKKSDPIASPVRYPASKEPFPRRLAGLAAMVAAGLPMRCVALTAPGAYDTHDSQPNALDQGLRLTASSLLAFQRDLEARGVADRVVCLVWSEFGRRPAENASNGTDHGAAGTAFLIGTKVSGTLVGEYPGLARLDADDNLRATSDFRGLYRALLEDWLRTDATGLVPDAHRFAAPTILR